MMRISDFATGSGTRYLTMTDKPVYLAHHTIPPQLQGEVQKCLDTWLQQGIIPLQAHMPQVVIVQKKTGEIRLCMDYHKLNSITVRDAELTKPCRPAIGSSDLAQGYLQLAMEESYQQASMSLLDAFWKTGSSFCRLMEQCG